MSEEEKERRKPKKKTLSERLDEKVAEMNERNERLISELPRRKIKKFKLLRQISLPVIIILVIVFWGRITGFIASEIHYVVSTLGAQNEAVVIANYLLALLIFVTAGVEGIPMIRDWWKRPILKLNSFSYSVHHLRVKHPEDSPEEKVGIAIVYLNLFNHGRGEATEPAIYAQALERKLLGLNYNIETSRITKGAGIIPANVYSTRNHNDLAIEFMRKGLRDVPFIEGHGQGRRFVLGFAFEDGDRFYFASEEGAQLSAVKFHPEPAYASFIAYCRNGRMKVIGRDMRMDFTAWDKVRLDFTEWKVRPEPELEA